MATVRYLVDDVARCVPFYVGTLGFEEIERYGPAIAILRRDDLVLWLAGPVSSAARPMPDGSQPAPGGWNRLVLTTEDIDAMVSNVLQFRAGVLRLVDSKAEIADQFGNVIPLSSAARRPVEEG